MSDLLIQLRSSLDRYDVRQEVGRGGMATVFLANDPRHDRLVAIKVVHPEISAAIGTDRFLREIRLAARLQHPHILPLYDSGEAAGHLYYVMPFVDGENLRDRLHRETQLPQDDVIRIAGEVASALEYAHRHGVVHRDVKPENIMLTSGAAVLSDFGIARVLSAADSRLTQTGTVIGSPAYMSPEQATGAATVDGRSDQYSLACVVYEMLVGQPPFTGPSVQAVIAKHSLDTVSPPSIVRGTISPATETALLRALSKVPADRFATVTEFAGALASSAPGPAAQLHRTTATARSTDGRTHIRMKQAVRWSALLIVLTAATWLAFVRPFSGDSAKTEIALDPTRIAVTYFDDRSAEGELRYLADGLTEALIRELARLPELRVVSPNGVAHFRATTLTPDSVARALNAGTLVLGTLNQSDRHLRTTVSLVNGGDGRVVDSKTIEVDRHDAIALRDSLSHELSLFLRQRLGREILELQTRGLTRDAMAWELLLRARTTAAGIDALLAAADTTGGLKELARADSLLALASTRDRRWIAPVLERGWLAYASRRLAPPFDKTYGAKWTATALAFAEEARRIDPEDVETLRLRGTARYMQFLLNIDASRQPSEQLLASAEGDLRAAAAPANPNQASAWALLSHLLMRKGETAAGKLAALRAYEADPYLAEAPNVLWRLTNASLDLQDATEADRWCREGARRFAADPFFLECQISVEALPGRRPEVQRLWQLYERQVSLYPAGEREFRSRRAALLVAMGLVRAGLADSARAVALRARPDATVDPKRDLRYVEILLRNLLGDREEALRLVGEYLATNPQDRSTMARDSTWWLRGLRDDPRFRALVGTS